MRHQVHAPGHRRLRYVAAFWTLCCAGCGTTFRTPPAGRPRLFCTVACARVHRYSLVATRPKVPGIRVLLSATVQTGTFFGKVTVNPVRR